MTAVATLAHSQPEYAALLDRIRADEWLVGRMWVDAESKDRPRRWSARVQREGRRAAAGAAGGGGVARETKPPPPARVGAVCV